MYKSKTKNLATTAALAAAMLSPAANADGGSGVDVSAVESKTKNLATTAAVGAAMLSPAAFAGGGGSSVDVSSVVSAIQGAATPIASIGAAVLIVLVGIKVYKWIRRAM